MSDKTVKSTKDIETWVFDLDNTLYHHEIDLFKQIDVKMGAYLAKLFDVDLVEARRIQKKYLVEYGTTLRGLMHHHDVDPGHYLADVHDIDLSPIKEDAKLRETLEDLKGKKLIFTNADTPYSERVLDRLGIAHLFDGIFDVHAADFKPKPDKSTYQSFLKVHNVKPKAALMVEDMARNLVPAKDLGMHTVWINTGSVWGEADHDQSHIDVEIDALTPWLHRFSKNK